MAKLNFTGTLKSRTQINNTPAVTPSDACIFANGLMDVFKNVGMIACSNTEYSGQSGKWVTGVAGEGETQVPSTIKGSSSNTSLELGYNCFKHPVLNIIIKVSVYYRELHSAGYGYMACYYTIGTQLSSGGFFGNTIQYYPMALSGGSSGSRNEFHANSYPVYAYCADDAFWIYSPNYCTSYNNSNYFAIPSGISLIGLGLFASANDNSKIIMLGTPTNSINDNGVSGVQPTSCSDIEGGGSRFWLFKNNNISYLGSAAPVFMQSDIATVVSDVGYRVVRAKKLIDGVYYHFPFGFMNMALSTADQTLPIDLNGEGTPSIYKLLPALGPCNTSRNNAPITSHLAPLFPW